MSFRYVDPNVLKKFRKYDRVRINNPNLKCHGAVGTVMRCWSVDSVAYCSIRRDDTGKAIACVKQGSVEHLEE